MSFAAAFQTHAIEEVGFRAILKFPLSNEMLQALQEDEVIRSILPIQEVIPQVDVLLKPDARGIMTPFPKESGLAALIFSSAKPDGTPSWQLRAEGQMIEIKCRDYARWANIWQKASKLMHQVFSAFPDQTEIQGASLHYIDHFLWAGDEKDYNLLDLINDKSDYVLPAIFLRGPIWHLHQGWFDRPDVYEKFGEDAALLHRLHMNGSRRNGRLMVIIEHLCQLNILPDGILASKFFDGVEEKGVAEQTFDGLHQANKKVMVHFIRPQICESIGLRVTEAMSDLAKRIVI